jgi:Fe-S-cluster containining protein
MIAIDDVLISDDVVKSKFVCDLEACHGACCWEGEWGAPLAEEEPAIIESVWKQVAPYLTEESRMAVAKYGFGTWYGDEEKVLGTPLVKSGACAYLIWDGKGIGKCSFEQAFADGKIDWPKPMSCHLYPIRVRKLKNGTEAWNYSRWSICSAACKNGKKLKVPLYKFLKAAIVRAKGRKFYKQLEACAESFQEVHGN